MEESPVEAIEVKEELMVSPIGGNPTQRQAYFLKPVVTSINEQVFDIPSLSLSAVPPTFDPKNWSLHVDFRGWRTPQNDWKQWVRKMGALHGSTWKRAGIHEAILNSTYEIRRNNDLVIGLAEKWCLDTKSFIFSWGETTITLEDMVVFGYSVLGSPVFEKNEEMEETVKKLEDARLELNRSSARKADQCRWIKNFMNSGSEIEHEAFLALWLSRFVFPISNSVIVKLVFHIAVNLASGTRVALAPAILASIYRDLGKLKENIVALTKLENNSSINLNIMITSPFQLVQIWAWERFLKLTPKQNLIDNGEPRFTPWHKKTFEVKNWRVALDSAKEKFNWRPYDRNMKSSNMPKFYIEKETWASDGPDFSEQVESFAVCLRISKLVGLELNCIEDYFPHRVAMQFGFDQDLPARVSSLVHDTRERAWIDYSKSSSYTKLYIPSRYFEAEVTTRYMDWWKQSVSCLNYASEDEENLPVNMVFKGVKRTREEGSSMEKTVKRRKGTGTNRDYRSSGFKLTPGRFDTSAVIDLGSMKKSEKLVETCKAKKEDDEGLSLKMKALVEANDSAVPPGFPPKSNLMVGRDSTGEDTLSVAELLKSKKLDDCSDCEVSTSKANEDLEKMELHRKLGEENEQGYKSDTEGSDQAGYGDEYTRAMAVQSRMKEWVSRIERIFAEMKAK